MPDVLDTVVDTLPQEKPVSTNEETQHESTKDQHSALCPSPPSAEAPAAVQSSPPDLHPTPDDKRVDEGDGPDPRGRRSRRDTVVGRVGGGEDGDSTPTSSSSSTTSESTWDAPCFHTSDDDADLDDKHEASHDGKVRVPDHPDYQLPLDVYMSAPFAICGRCSHVQLHGRHYGKGHISCLCMSNAVCCPYGFANYLRAYPTHRPVPLPKLTFLMKYNIADPSCLNALLHDDALTKRCHLVFEKVQKELNLNKKNKDNTDVAQKQCFCCL